MEVAVVEEGGTLDDRSRVGRLAVGGWSRRPGWRYRVRVRVQVQVRVRLALR